MRFKRRPSPRLAPFGAEAGASSALLSPAAIARRLVGKWYWIAAGALVGAGLAALYALTLPNEYQAISRILLEPRGITPIRDTVLPQGLNSEATIAYSQSQVDIISSVSVLAPVIEDEGLRGDPEFTDGAHWLSGLGLSGLKAALVAEDDAASPSVLKALYERLYVGRLPNTFVIEIGFTSEDPNKAARIANAITRSYLASESGAQNAAAASATTDLSARLDALRAKVAASEALIDEHKRKFNLVETNGRLVEEQSLANLNDQLARATTQTAEVRSQVELSKSLDTNDVVGGGLPAALQTPGITQARLQYQRAQADVSRLSVKLGERHPQLREAVADLRSAENSIRAELKRVAASSERELKRAQSREADLRRSVLSLRDRALATNGPSAELRELERRLDADRLVYESFLKRSRETGEQSGIASRNARVITEALPPEEKAGPRRTLMTLAGGMVGSGITAALLLLPLAFGAAQRFLRNGRDVPGQDRRRVSPAAREKDEDLYPDDHPVEAKGAVREGGAAKPEPLAENAAPTADSAVEEAEKPAASVPVVASNAPDIQFARSGRVSGDGEPMREGRSRAFATAQNEQEARNAGAVLAAARREAARLKREADALTHGVEEARREAETMRREAEASKRQAADLRREADELRLLAEKDARASGGSAAAPAAAIAPAQTAPTHLAPPGYVPHVATYPGYYPQQPGFAGYPTVPYHPAPYPPQMPYPFGYPPPPQAWPYAAPPQHAVPGAAPPIAPSGD